MVEKGNMQMWRAGVWKNEQGFTLIELSMVLLIAGILSFVAVPRLKNILWHGDIKGAVRRVTGIIKYTHSQSAVTKIRHRLNYDLDNNRYWITIKNAEGEFIESNSILLKARKLPNKVVFRDIYTPREGEVRHGIAYTEFVPNGLVENTVIHLENDEERVFTLIIKPLTGNVKVYDSYIKVER